MGALADIPTGQATGVAGSILAVGVTTSVPANLTGFFVPKAGAYYCYSVGANCKWQVFDSDGGGTWHDITAAGAIPGLIYSDGINMRFANTHATAAQNVITQKIG